MSTSSAGVVVWEWLNDGGRWQAYDPRVSDYIEGFQTGLVHLGHVDTAFGSAAVDLSAKIQLDRGSAGPARPVRRQVYQADGPAGQGISWQWSGDRLGEWHRYDFEVAGILESAYSAGQALVDLSQHPCALPYKIDFKKLTQVRVETGFVRRVKRVIGNWRYMKSAVLPSSASSSTYLQPVHRTAPAAHSAKPLNGPSNGSLASMCPFNVLRSFSYHNGQVASNGFGLPSVPPLQVPMQFNNGVPYQGAIMPPSMTSSSSSLAMMSSHVPVLPSTCKAAKYNKSVKQNNGLILSFSFGPTNVNAPGSSSMLLQNGVTSFSSIPPSQSVSTASAKKAGSRSRNTVGNGNVKKPKVNDKQTSTVSNADLPTNPEDLLKPYFISVKQPPSDEDCAICCEQVTDPSGYDQSSSDPNVIQLVNCKHQFHKACLFAMYHSGTKDGSLQCPTCKTIYGTKFGNCPRGTMDYVVIPGALSGYNGCNTIRIMYMIPAGVQGPEHPNPGQKFTARGFPRYGYLPDNSQGRKVLGLLIKAWERRLTFTIGTSVTTGESDTVVWNEIHHKTEPTNNSGHGYPDPNYLENVTAELAVHGISDLDNC